MKSVALGVALAITGAVGVGATQAALSADDKMVTITGCVVKGDGGYVLMPLPEHGGAAAVLPPTGTSGTATGTSGSAAADLVRVLYWLDDDDEVDDHAGQRVEITGELEGDIDEGEISVEREDDGTVELEFKHDGKTIGVKLPNIPGTIGTAGSAITDQEKDYDVAVRKVDVKTVKTLASVCQ